MWRHPQRQRPTLIIVNRLEGWPAPARHKHLLTGQWPGWRLRAVSMSTFVNVWPGRWSGTDQPVSTLVSTKWAAPAGGVGPGSRSASRSIVTQSECATLRRCAARYALLVRILALALRQFAPVVRTQVRNPHSVNLPCEPGRPACYQKLWFPRAGFHGIAASGDHHAAVNDHMKTTMLAAQRQPIRSQVFSGSTV